MTTAQSPARPRTRSWTVERDEAGVRLRELVYRLLCLFWFTLPGQGVISIGGAATISKGAGVLLAVMAVVSLLRSGAEHRLNDYLVLLLLYAGWVALSLFWTLDVPVTQQRVLTFAQLVIMVLITWEFAHSERRIRGLMASWIAGCLVIGLIIVFAFAFGQSESRYTAPGTHPGDQAYALLIAIPMAWYLSLGVVRRVLVFAYRLFVPFALLATVLTASRAALVSAAFALIIIPCTLGRISARARVSVGLGVLASAVVGLLFTLSDSGPIARLATTSSEITSGTLDQRTTLWAIALRLIGDHPILGTGAGSSNQVIGAQYTMSRSVHNTFLLIPVEVGVFGAALFLLFFLAAVYRSITSLRAVDRIFSRSLLIIFVAALIPRPADYSKATYAILTLFALIGAVLPLPSALSPQPPYRDEVATEPIR